MSHTIVLSTHALTKIYDGSTALEDLNLEMRKGEVLGYLGPNGAGKTTTIRILLGLLRATRGSAKILDMDTWKYKEQIHRKLAYVPGETNLWPQLSGGETLDLLGGLHGAYDESYRKHLINVFDFDESKKVRSYSKGNRQKVSLIAALMTRADLLIMDEPTSGLDPIMEQVFRECVAEAKSRGQSVLLSSHILGEVEALCDRVAILRKGRLVEVGTLDELRHLSTLQITATFSKSPPKIDGLDGVSDVHVRGSTLMFRVQGSVAPVLSRLADAKPLSLLSSEPSLEELFLSLYGEDKK